MKHKANRINESTTTVSTVGAIHELPLQKDLPEGWVNTNLEDVVDILDRRRVPVNAEDREKRHGTIPYYGATGQVGWIDDYLFDEELVLLGEDGAPFLEPTKQKAYIIRGKSWVNNHAHVLRARNGIPNAYIKYYLDIVDYHKFVSGTTRLKLNQSAMRQITVPIAPPDQQKLIVAEIEKQFSRLDEAVTALKRIQANLKRYKASVLKAAVEGKLTEQWRKEHPDIEPASELLKRILTERRKKWEEDYVKKYVAAHGHAPKDDAWKKKYKEPASPDTLKLPELPKGWVWVSLDTLIVEGPQNGLYLPKSSYKAGIAILRIDDYQDEHSKPVAELRQVETTKSNVSNYGLNNQDLVINRVNSPSHLGKCLVVGPRNLPALFESNMMRLKVSSYTDVQFVAVYLRSKAGRARLIQNAKWAVNQASINQGDVGATAIPLPPADEQEYIIGEVERFFSVAAEIEVTAVASNLKRAERLRQSILKKAFSGNLVVNMAHKLV